MPPPDTIAAIATAPGEGAIGIVRMSGPDASSILLRVFRRSDGSAVKADHFPAQLMRYGLAVDPERGETLDEVLAVCMKAPQTYTREDVVEIHGHGGTTVLRRLLEAVLDAGARLAEPGEFTKRAFLNGRLELDRAEAVIDVIRARTDRALRTALASLSGVTEKMTGDLRGEMLTLAAHVEAWIDFPEEDIPSGDREDLGNRAQGIIGSLENLLRTFREGKALREGLALALVGRPNVGKSSLLNALLQEERAIVTAIAGTTRDTIEEHWAIGGIPLRLVDTAGIRTARDHVEAEGVRRSRAALAQADLLLLVLDGSEPLTAEDREILGFAAERRAVLVVNKADLPPALDPSDLDAGTCRARARVLVSAKRGDGMDELRAAIEREAVGEPASTETPLIGRTRHRVALDKAVAHLKAFTAGLTAGELPELLAIDVRDAVSAVDEIVGVAVPDDVLDVIFGEFCIGK